MLDNGFDANADENQGNITIPEGVYNLIVASTEMKDTQDGKGKYIRISYQVIDEGQYKGSRF